MPILTNRKLTPTLYIKKKIINYELRIDNLINNLPNHHAPTHLGSVVSIFGSTVKSAYKLVQNEPTIKPKAGPKIRTPIVIAAIKQYVKDNTYNRSVA